MRRKKTPQVTTYSEPPAVCPKPNCGCTNFIPHEDGWQCLNCMKIIYRSAPLPYIANNRPERIGQYNYQKLGVTNDDLENSSLKATNASQNQNGEAPAGEETTWDWGAEYEFILELSRIHRFSYAGQFI